MSNQTHQFVDVSGAAPREQNMWPSIVIPKEAIELEAARLQDIAKPDNGRRASMIVHPQAAKPGLGLAPGIDVTINVLNPGERTFNLRKNSNMVEICIAGSGVAVCDGKSTRVSRFDVWNTPSMSIHSYYNDSNTPWVRLSYSNAPLLEKLEVHYVEEFEGDVPPADAGTSLPATPGQSGPRARDLALREQITEEGAWLLGYEWLIDIDVIESKSLHWPWSKVSSYLPSVEDIAKGYNGRRLFVLYNPATERRIGTTHSFFATISSSPPDTHHVPHRHSSAAMNYYLRGRGYSKVNGERLEWKEGDLILSAPGWAMHSHHSGDQVTSALTIQDHPLQIAMESLIWQERIKEPILTLGRQVGFESNRAQLTTAG
ncbi:AraC family ligand binding domain-containing protein [Pusillimonas sp. MFBS29]|uniref:cupin domain-containing protein n=1 Tax=Pusillimonas sp. MFBS29 TaxID=2886690 RepID=UPI001D0FDCB0|nr:AraC family ligand binding domain-containing protein [Pusillimonas sp. MFBS29]MCC2597211.1 AraC family ligand binding domain-containing protein [Pusillimonas sp. MFBS29]